MYHRSVARLFLDAKHVGASMYGAERNFTAGAWFVTTGSPLQRTSRVFGGVQKQK